jgi:TonB family protein
MKPFGLFLALVLLSASPAFAQLQPPTANPVIQHYRAFQAALDEGDFARAEVEANAALAASEVRDGDGGRTGVLAMNLALLRLDTGNEAEARAPAARALAIVEMYGEASGVDPVLARLVDAHVRLRAPGSEDDDAARLLEALLEARSIVGLEERVVAGAVALGMWRLERDRFADSATAFELAAGLSRQDDSDLVSLRALARIGEAATLLNDAETRREFRAAAAAARPLIDEALGLLCELVFREDGREEPTPLQRLYARGLAWDSVIGMYDPSDAREPQMAPISLIGNQICPLRIRWEGLNMGQYYPRGALNRGEPGVVVMRIVVNSDGSVARIDALASAPAEGFVRAASRIVDEVGLRLTDEALPGCVMEQIKFIRFVFSLDR